MARGKTKRRSKPKGRGRGELTFQHRKVVQLDDGTVGYPMRPERSDDCFRAALATAMQVRPAEIPDPLIDRRIEAGHDPETINAQGWALILGWLDGRGLQVVYHEAVPVARERWVGVWCSGATADDAAAAVDGVLNGSTVTRRARRELYRSGTDVLARNKHHFADHCLVMSHDEILFDPAVGLTPPPGHTLPPWRAADITYGLSFEPKEN